ncbi:MAG TPA: hypothetical protein V6C72_12905 [Chroococcales cyanobacterium]
MEKGQHNMLSASAGIFLIDFIVRPFAKIAKKMPYVMLLFLLLLYGFVAYVVLKSVYLSDQHPY